MSYAMQRYEESVDQRMKAKGFDFSILLTALIPVIVESISGCFQKNDTNSITKRLVGGKDDYMVKKQVELAIRKEEKSAGRKLSADDRLALRDAILEEWATDPARTQEMVNEMKAVENFGML